jgi:hypothetical protein
VSGDIRHCKYRHDMNTCTSIFAATEPPRFLEAFALTVSVIGSSTQCTVGLFFEMQSGIATSEQFHYVKVNNKSSPSYFVTLPRPVLMNFGSSANGDATDIHLTWSDRLCEIDLTTYSRLAEQS